MAKETKNLKLNKPDKTDFYNIDLVNANMDKIDEAITEKASKEDIPKSLPANGGNADTVGGKHASDFVIRGSITNVSTFDDFIDCGVYRVNEILPEVKLPAGFTNYGQLLVLNGDNSDTVTQIYCNYGNNKIFSRSCHNWGIDPSNWNEWKKVNDLFDINVIDVQNADESPSGISVLTGGVKSNPYNFHCTLMTFTHGSAYAQQIAFPWGSSETQDVKYRVKDANVWYGWKNLNDGGNANTLGGLNRYGYLEKAFLTFMGVDFLASLDTLTENQLPNCGNYVVRGYDCSNMPYNSGDFVCYVSSVSPISQYNTRPYYTVVAVDVRTNAMYENTKNNGVWTGWAKMLNNKNVAVQSTAPTSPITGDLWIW